MIFFFTLAYPRDPGVRTIYAGLMGRLAKLGHRVKVFCPDENRLLGRSYSQEQDGVEVVRIPVGRIQKVNPLFKALNSRRFGRRAAAIAGAVAKVEPPALILYATPPIDIVDAVTRVRDQCGGLTYLLLKDIFPANAVDLGMIREGGWLWRRFRAKERRLYHISDVIGCMSPANKAYLEAHNPELDALKIEICPNSIDMTPAEELPAGGKGKFQAFGIPVVRLNLVYGGNLGKPQGIGFVMEILEALRGDRDVHITIVGDGTEFGRLEALKKRIGNTFTLLRKLPKSDYLSVLRGMDAGLVFLDHRFTIPNFPSRLLDYLDYGLPVLAATDRNSDIGSFLLQEGCGLWSESGDLSGFLRNLKRLKEDSKLEQMSAAARPALERHFTVQRSADVILRHLGGERADSRM
ncbi:MAG: glycosyltransferase WbuB [Holophagaceae bacterium]|nr:glycosyltransferase WbuB [Holophagaceae bacterium]